MQSTAFCSVCMNAVTVSVVVTTSPVSLVQGERQPHHFPASMHVSSTSWVEIARQSRILVLSNNAHQAGSIPETSARLSMPRFVRHLEADVVILDYESGMPDDDSTALALSRATKRLIVLQGEKEQQQLKGLTQKKGRLPDPFSTLS